MFLFYFHTGQFYKQLFKIPYTSFCIYLPLCWAVDPAGFVFSSAKRQVDTPPFVSTCLFAELKTNPAGSTPSLHSFALSLYIHLLGFVLTNIFKKGKKNVNSTYKCLKRLEKKMFSSYDAHNDIIESASGKAQPYFQGPLECLGQILCLLFQNCGQ